MLAQIFTLTMTSHVGFNPIFAFFGVITPSIPKYTTALNYYFSILNRPLKYNFCNFPEAPQFFISLANTLLSKIGWIGSRDNSSARSIATKTAVYLRDNNSINMAYNIYTSGKPIPDDVQEAVLLSAAIRNSTSLNLADWMSLRAIAQTAADPTLCDFVGTNLQNIPDMGSVRLVLYSAFQEGLCQPTGKLWELVKTYRISGVFTGAFSSDNAIEAIKNLPFLGPQQLLNEVSLIKQNMQFCSYL